MSLFETIEKDYVQAYKAKDAVRLTVLRLLKTAVKNRLVDLCRPGGTLDDAEMLDLIIKEGKQRQDSIEQFLFSPPTHPNAMSLFETIEKDYVQAYKAKDAVRLTVLRLLKTAVKNRLVDLCRPGGTLDDAEMLDLIIKEGKQRQDSIEQYTSAGRQDLADKEAAELAVIQSYLPKPLTEEELTALIDATIAEVGATSPREMGKVISAIMATHKGRVDGKALSAAVKARLTA